MKIKLIWLLLVLGVTGFHPVRADEKLPSLSVNSEIYSNVTITSVTTTDIYFSHARGLGNAKLKNLAPELQKRFHFNSAKSAATEQAQAEATANFLRQVATNRIRIPAAPPDQEVIDAPLEDVDGELVAQKLYAASFRGQRPPQIIVAEWLTPPPDVTNKFVLVDIWATWTEPARATIPHLNDLQARFKDKLVVLGLSTESVEEIRKMTNPAIQYSVGSDPEGRTQSALEVQAIPHSILIDPSGIVRYEGHAKQLDADHLEKLLAKYSQ